jgi:hypothetical protein
MIYTKSVLASLAFPLVFFLLLQSGKCVSTEKENIPATANALSNTMETDSQNKLKNRLPEGDWGGEHIRMQITGSGVAIEYDCAYGNIDGSIELEQKGGFEINGTYVIESGGPVTSDSKPNSRPAQYKGYVKGNKMTLTVTLIDSQVEVGTFKLVRGKEPNLFKCR